MLSFPADITLEKNKLFSGGSFIELLEWQVSETGEVVRIANHNEDVQWSNQTWSKFWFEGSPVEDTGGDTAESIDIKISAIDKVIQEQLEGLNNGGIGDTVIYRRVHSDNLENSNSILTAEFEIVNIDAGPTNQWVIFTLGQENFFLSQFPANVLRRDVCRYTPAMTAVCPYVNNSSCDRSFSNCLYLSQESVFGGQPGIPNGAFNIFDIVIRANVSPGAIVIRGYNPEVTGGGSITCNIGQITIASYNPAISFVQNISLTSNEIVINGFDANVYVAPQINVISTRSLTIAGYNPTITAEHVAFATLGEITIDGKAVSVVAGSSIQVNAGAVTVDGKQATIYNNLQINASDVKALTVDSNNVSIATGSSILCNIGQVVVDGKNVTINDELVINYNDSAITIDGYNVSVYFGVPIEISVTKNITINGYSVNIEEGGAVEQPGGGPIEAPGGDTVQEPS